MHFTLICIIISIIGVDAHTGRQTQSSERRKTRLFGHRAKQITKGQITNGRASSAETCTRIPVLTHRQHKSTDERAAKVAAAITLARQWTTVALVLRCAYIPPASLSSSLFRVQPTLCTYRGGFKGRAKWYSMRECEYGCRWWWGA